jgi:pimeloyl-ACP methyl ester carboxylesterase
VQPAVESSRHVSGPDLPALIVAGEADAPSVATEAAAAVPARTARRRPGAGHIVNLERPEAFHAALFAFLAEEVFRSV